MIRIGLRFNAAAGMALILATALGMLAPCAVQGANLCATDGFGQTFYLRFTPGFAPKAICSVVGWVDNGFGTVLTLHGSAIVSADKAKVRISLETVNHLGSQRVGLGMDTDLRLNGSGYYENMNMGGGYTEIAETWAAVTCPSARDYPFVSASQGDDAADAASPARMTPPVKP